MLSINRFYKNMEWVADEVDTEILIDKLDLPYTSVKFLPNKFNDFNVGLWAFPKIYAYGIQNEPFIHVDNDVFISEKLSSEIEGAELIVQNREQVNSYGKGVA